MCYKFLSIEVIRCRTIQIRRGKSRQSVPQRTAFFLDLFQDKKNLLELYKTLHPEDTDTTEDTLDIVTIDNVLTDNLYNDLGIMVGNNIKAEKPDTISLSKEFFDGADIDIEIKAKVILAKKWR